MMRALAPRSLLVLVMMLGSDIVPAIANEPIQSAGSPAQGSQKSTAAMQPEQDDTLRVSSTHHQCYQQTRFPQRRAKKTPAPSGP